jgi:hypothetical protein
MRLALIAVLITATAARAGTPFGGDDTGFIPPDKVTAKCENGVANALVSLAGKLFKCNIRDSDAKDKATGFGIACMPNDPSFDGVACQVTARSAYDAKVAKLMNCPPCLNTGSVRDSMTQLINSHNDMAFCDDTSTCVEDVGQPVQSTTGWVPAAADAKKCSDGEAKLLAKLAVSLLKCHVGSAKAQSAGRSFDEDGCEMKSTSKYDTGVTKVSLCTACLSAGGFATFRDLTHTLIDGQNSGPYCASPSGAFVN